MSTIPHIKFRISQGALDQSGRFTQACIHGVGGSLTEVPEYQKYMADIIAQALTITNGIAIENQRFTYKFPFKLA
mgnify:CR=1 FL=1